MAHSTRTFLLFILVLVLSHELIFIEGRNLRQNNHHSPKSAIMNTSKSNIGSPSLLYHPIRDLEEHTIDAFRPTTPGHSPGVGHSIKNWVCIPLFPSISTLLDSLHPCICLFIYLFILLFLHERSFNVVCNKLFVLYQYLCLFTTSLSHLFPFYTSISNYTLALHLTFYLY